MVQGSPEIPELSAVQALSPAAAPRAKAPATGAAKDALAQAPDSVELSPVAQKVAQLKAQAQAIPEVREDRVAQAQAQLAKLSSGGSELDAKIAEKLLTEI